MTSSKACHDALPTPGSNRQRTHDGTLASDLKMATERRRGGLRQDDHVDFGTAATRGVPACAISTRRGAAAASRSLDAADAAALRAPIGEGD